MSDPSQTTTPPADDSLADLRARADQAGDLSKTNTTLERENAFLKAGVDTDTPLGKLLLDGYKGELTKDAIKAAFAEVGGGQVPASTTTPTEEPPDPQAGRGDVQQAVATGGGTPPPLEAPPEDPITRGHRQFDEELRAGRTHQKAAIGMIGSLMTAAAEGDERAIWNGWSEEELAAERQRKVPTGR